MHETADLFGAVITPDKYVNSLSLTDSDCAAKRIKMQMCSGSGWKLKLRTANWSYRG